MIGLFDSGIGGLTVTREVMRCLPGQALLYLGDTARTPYGNKSADVVESYGLQAAKFLIDNGATVIVVACNTVSAVGLGAIKKAYPQVPLFDVISPAVESVIKQNLEGSIGIIGTRALVNSRAYQNLLGSKGKFKITARAAPLLVPLVEEGWLDKIETKRIIKYYLRPFKEQRVDTLVLACTHYPLLKSLIASRMGRGVKIIDPAIETAATLEKWLYDNKSEAAKIGKGEARFCVTDFTLQTEKIAQKWLKQNIKLEQINLK